jgi:hypothetical protein
MAAARITSLQVSASGLRFEIEASKLGRFLTR